MKILICILMILFISCTSTKSTIKTIQTDTVYTDSIKSNLPISDSISTTYETLSEPDILNISEEEKELNYVEKINKPNVTIIDNSVVSDKPSEGLIAYSVPDKMKVNNKYIIKVRITKDKSKSSKTILIIGERNILINDETVKTNVSIENIKIDDTMMAEIISDTTSFYIKSLDTETQNLDSSGYTEWSWQITPLKSGKGYLKMIIKIKSSNKDIVVFDKVILVGSNISYSIKEFISSYWQWIITTIIIPLIIFFYKKRKNKKKVIKANHL